MRVYSRIQKEARMKEKVKGQFSLSLMSLQLQLKTLLDDAGGDQAVGLLDVLCSLSKSEQAVALKVFTETIERVTSGEIRLTSKEDQCQKDLADTLYKEIVNDMRTSPIAKKIKLEVYDGGKNKPDSSGSASVIKLDDLRTARKSGTKPIIN